VLFSSSENMFYWKSLNIAVRQTHNYCVLWENKLKFIQHSSKSNSIWIEIEDRGRKKENDQLDIDNNSGWKLSIGTEKKEEERERENGERIQMWKNKMKRKTPLLTATERKQNIEIAVLHYTHFKAMLYEKWM
jgi:hypothetical protein